MGIKWQSWHMLPVDRLGFKMLRESGWFPIKNDKKGGFTLHSFKDVNKIYTGMFSQQFNHEVDASYVVKPVLVERFKTLCGHIGKKFEATA